MREITSPGDTPAPRIFKRNGVPCSTCYVFLAGSIEMGKAEDWQHDFTAHFRDIDNDLVILNPRRPDWDPSWEQSIKDPRFKEQVEWELNGLENSDLVVMNLIPGTHSPISLLELGLMVKNKPVMVLCPPGFWRRGNVEVVINRYGGYLFEDLDVWYREIRLYVETYLNLKRSPK